MALNAEKSIENTDRLIDAYLSLTEAIPQALETLMRLEQTVIDNKRIKKSLSQNIRRAHVALYGIHNDPGNGLHCELRAKLAIALERLAAINRTLNDIHVETEAWRENLIDDIQAAHIALELARNWLSEELDKEVKNV